LLDRFQPSYVRVKSGSFGERSVGGRVSIHPGSANLSIYDSQYESVGNFRENNKFVQDSYALNASVPLGKLWTGTYFSLWSKADRGIAGSTVYPSPAAGKTNDDWIHLLTVRGLSNWGRSEISLGLTGSREHYTNPDWSVNSRHRVSTRRLRALHRFLQRGPFQHTAVLEIIQHHVDSDDAGNHQELMGAIGILSQVRLKSTFLLSGSTRTGWNLQRGTFVVNGSLGLVWQGNLQVLRSILFNAGTSYRNPTFNDLYWEDPFGYSQGSPDLRPERGTSAHAGVELWPLGFESLQVRATAYHFFTNDLIQWIPGVDFVYSPRNLSKTKSYGVMLTAALLPEKFPIRGAITTDQNRSRLLDDGANGGKRLLYVPAVSHWAELTWATRLVDLNISYRFLGQRRYSYVGESVLKAYDRLDLSLTGHVPPVYGLQPTIVLGVRNVQNRVGQQSVYGYPEPERALFSTLTVALP
ncbi:MAG: hypothetical protein ACE5GH_02515, partial [Fidelibacterota bacterium]